MLLPTTDDILDLLDLTIEKYGKPEQIHTDN